MLNFVIIRRNQEEVQPLSRKCPAPTQYFQNNSAISLQYGFNLMEMRSKVRCLVCGMEAGALMRRSGTADVYRKRGNDWAKERRKPPSGFKSPEVPPLFSHFARTEPPFSVGSVFLFLNNQNSSRTRVRAVDFSGPSGRRGFLMQTWWQFGGVALSRVDDGDVSDPDVYCTDQFIRVLEAAQ